MLEMAKCNIPFIDGRNQRLGRLKDFFLGYLADLAGQSHVSKVSKHWPGSREGFALPSAS